ncbi:uncharacterized protein LOC109859930 [Pseudomyrmex gracilis]|uniref:uncharacterized protein LOC109859930 n=1 Tax=Pseudomyrmex gracilis TaxID=219809 RepID=UPI000995B0ED|nr:uncharacterized protein LOC109859930 [Pseudomyrmex gracilis]
MSGISKIKRKIYSKEAMLKALEAVKSGTFINAASRLYNIPRSSIHSKVINKYSRDKPGPSSVLSDLEESDLVKWILFMSSRGCPVTKDHLINSVAMIVKKLNKPNPFVDDRPGRYWYAAFLKRHPELSKRMCKNVTLSRALVSETSVRKWFQNIDDYLKKEQLQNIDLSRIFNTDETALMLNPKESAVLAEKRSKNIYNIVNNNEKQNVTVLVTANAAGQLAPTMVVFAYKRVPSSIYVTMPEEFCAGHSDKGWMTATLFFEYIANKFHPWLIKSGITLPVILYLDGYVSHLTQPLSEFCHLHQIILIALPPNTTHFLQPMDVSFFSKNLQSTENSQLKNFIFWLKENINPKQKKYQTKKNKLPSVLSSCEELQ